MVENHQNKVAFNIASEAIEQKLLKNAKNVIFFENLKLAVKQCYQTSHFLIGQKMPEKMRHFESFSYTVGQKYPSNYVSGLYVALNDVIGCSQIHQNASLAFIATDYYTAYHSNY